VHDADRVRRIDRGGDLLHDLERLAKA
jgi:hypothetical protein